MTVVGEKQTGSSRTKVDTRLNRLLDRYSPKWLDFRPLETKEPLARLKNIKQFASTADRPPTRSACVIDLQAFKNGDNVDRANFA